MMRLAILLLSTVAASAQPFDYVIEDFAGRERLPDGVAALEAHFTSVLCVTSGPAGDIYICSASNGGISRLDADGRVTRVFGSGISGFSAFGPRDAGDGGPALEAQGLPQDAVVDAEGVIFFVQTNASRVRRIGLDGVVTTIAGGPTTGFSGDGGPAVDAELSTPLNIALGPEGSLYISDRGNRRIRRIDPSGVITTIAGVGPSEEPARLTDGVPALEASIDPRGLDVDDQGDVYFCDLATSRVRRVSADDGLITTVAGTLESGLTDDGGPATDARLDVPLDVVLDPDGGFYVASGPRIRRVSPEGIITTVAADSGAPPEADLNFPRSLAWGPSGELLAVYNPTVRRVLEDGSTVPVAGRPRYDPDARRAEDIALYYPNTVRLDPDGAPVIADSFNDVVRRVDADGSVETIAGNGLRGAVTEARSTPAVPMNRIRDIAYDSFGNAYMTEWFNHWVRVATAAGDTVVFAGNGRQGFTGDSRLAVSARLAFPRGLAVDPDDHLYIADTGNHRIRRVDRSTGRIVTVAGSSSSGFSGDGDLGVRAQLNSPRGLAFDDDGNLYVADMLNHRIRRIAADGIITTVAGNGDKGHSGDGGPATAAALNEPHRIALDADGYLYVADSYNHVVRMVTPAGVIHTIAGAPLDPGHAGDGGPALAAKLNLPKGLDIRPNGAVLFSDNDNHRIRILRPQPRLVADAVVNAAAFTPKVAPGSIASVFGTNLAGASATALEKPLPTQLSFAELLITDSSGVERPAGQFFASKTQSNFYVDPETAPGPATLRVLRDSGAEAETTFEVAEVAPGLFSPAVYLLVRADGSRQSGLTIDPINLGGPDDQVFLTIFATGLRNADTVAVTIGSEPTSVRFAGEQGQFLGLDQVDVGPLPRSLSGAGAVTLELAADGQAATMELSFE